MFEPNLLQPAHLIGAVQLRFSTLSQFEEEGEMAVPQPFNLVGAQQSLASGTDGRSPETNTADCQWHLRRR